MKGEFIIKLDLLTLVVILSLVMGAQIISLFIQYRTNKTYKEIKYWLLGSGLIALGLVFLGSVNQEYLQFLAYIGNPLIILGHIILYVGIRIYLNLKLYKWFSILAFMVFTLSYYYFMFINDNTSIRTFLITAFISTFSFLIAYVLFFKRGELNVMAVNFTAIVFLFYGAFNLWRTIYVTLSPTMTSYIDQQFVLALGFVVSILFSSLWTFGSIIMVNQRLNMDNQLEKEKFQSIFNTNLYAQSISRAEDGFIVDVNDGFAVLSGYSKKEAIGAFIQEIKFWNDLADRQIFIEKLNNDAICENMEVTLQRKDGRQFSGMISARIIKIQSVPHIISVISDITERKLFETALIESEEKYRSILNASPDDITITDLTGHIIMISPAAREMFGYDTEFDSFIGMHLVEFIVPEDVERAKANIQKMSQGQNQKPNEYRGVRQNKSIFDIEVNSGFVYGADGKPSKMVFIIRDITERKLIENQLQILVQQLEIEKNTAQINSITDALTGLANRRYFDEALEKELSRLRLYESTLSLIMLDIDYFKKFNDNYGHLAGDECLRVIASTLKAIIVQPSAVVARYGGEEFIVILPETDERKARVLGEKIRKSVENLAIPHITSDISKYVTVSLGITTVNPSEVSSPEQVLGLVDGSLYLAKKGGRNCCVYSSK